MKRYSFPLICLLSLFLLNSCFEDQDDSRCLAGNLEIQDFIYKGMNNFYLYKDEQPVLSNDRFSNQSELNNYLSGFSSPEAFFSSLLVPQDRFSVLVDDYRALESSFNGISLNNGMAFGLVQIQSSGDIFAYVRYVLPNSSASRNGVSRGMLFNRIDGTTFTQNNFNQLLSERTYTIGLADLDENGNLSSLNQEITLTKEEYTENPVFIDTVINIQDQKVGYLMYNSFTRTFDDDLNAAFARFQGAGINNLVVDLRYNGGGSIESSNDLGSMITGQFEGELFTRQVYNENIEPKERFFNSEISSGEGINNLNLNSVYVLTTSSTASASELLISSLMPYIDVQQIGTPTAGKFQGSITVYDSPDFSRDNVNLCHTYAIQPLVLKTVNANGFTDYADGIQPEIEFQEDFRNLGQLGNPNEPFLAKALELITGTGRPVRQVERGFKILGENGMDSPNFQRMYNDKSENLKLF
jgi:C-terminal processing protease CtpA/Prc